MVDTPPLPDTHSGPLDLAIIVPVGPGDEAWRGLLPALLALPVSEIVLVFADATAADRAADRATDRAVDRAPDRAVDAVATLAADGRVRALSSAAGRARQQNAGVAGSRARWLWLLHADSRLLPQSWPAARACVARDEQVLAYFDLRFAADGPRAMRLNEIGARWRSRWLGLPFGDQGFLLRRDVFARLGGFDETLPGGEDHALVWAAKRQRVPLCPLPAALLTSARKYGQQGWTRTTLRHLWLTFAQARRFRNKESA